MGRGVRLSRDTAAADRALLDRHGRFLLNSARASIMHGFEFGHPLTVDPASAPAELRVHRAAPVVLRLDDVGAGDGTRRSAGGVRAWRPLLADVIGNAFAAAFADRRHAPLKPADRVALRIAIMLLGEPQAIDSAATATALAPRRDGLLAEWPTGESVLFPDAWDFYKTPAAFSAEALRRAAERGAPPDASPRLYRFSVVSVGDPA